jgi:hypothetical protein
MKPGAKRKAQLRAKRDNLLTIKKKFLRLSDAEKCEFTLWVGQIARKLVNDNGMEVENG